MVDIDNLLSKSNEHYRFHGVRSQVLSQLISQSENGQIILWGEDHNDFIEEEEVYSEYVQGEGYLYSTSVEGMELSCDPTFCNDGGIVLVLEKIVDEPQEWYPRPGDKRERLIRVEEW